MRIRSRAIWLVAIGFIVAVAYQHTLDFWGLILILVARKFVDNVLGDTPENPSYVPEIERDDDEEDATEAAQPIDDAPLALPPGQHIVTAGALKQVRNMLMRHHEQRRTDVSYVDSPMSKDTEALVANLNVFLQGK